MIMINKAERVLSYENVRTSPRRNILQVGCNPGRHKTIKIPFWLDLTFAMQYLFELLK